jgi:Tol biopolymer transport system component
MVTRVTASTVLSLGALVYHVPAQQLGEGIHALAAAGGAARVVALPRYVGPDIHDVGRPALSPDGARLAFLRNLGEAENDRSRLFVVARAGGGPRLLTGRRDAVLPAWSPDGRRLAFLERFPRRWLTTVGARGCCVRRIAALGGPAALTRQAWSPDGRLLAFELAGDVFVVSTRGGPPRNLTSSAAHDSAPSFSRDGRIAWLRHGNVHVMAADGTAKTRVTHSRRGFPFGAATWSSTGRLAFRGADGVYATVRGFRVARRIAAADADRLTDPVWAPDGAQLAVAGRLRTLDRPGFRRSLWRIDLTSGRRVALTPGTIVPDELDWGR